MALILADRVRETSTTTGTGALSLAGAVVGYQTFSSAIGNTNTCYYAISNPGIAEWEVGIGTYATSGNTLTRTTVLKSSNANAAVSFSAGTKDVFVTYPAGKSVYQDASGNVTLTGALTVTGGVDKLTSATGVVSVAAATAPSVGQVLMATSATVATWQTVATPSAATPTVLGTVYGITPAGTAAVALGYQAATTTTSATGVTAIGYQALQANTSSNNTAVGYQALYSETTAGNNTAIGYQAGRSITTGTDSVFIGYLCGYNATASVNGNNNVFVGPYCHGSGTNISSEYLFGWNLAGKGNETFFVSGSSGAYNSANSLNWSVTSDVRLKKNIVDNNVGLEKIIAIQVRNFEYRTENEITELPTHTAIKKESVQLGVIAQELQLVLPECVKTESTGVMSVNADNLTWYMVNAIKELKAEFEAYKSAHP